MQSHPPQATNPASASWTTSTTASMSDSTGQPPFVMTGRVQHQELELADAAMHGRQRKKDRRELTRHAADVFAGCGEEEFDALARIADAARQVFDAVHGAQRTLAAASTQVRRAPPACD